MDQTKTEVIAGTLTKQAERNRELSKVARREMHEHSGATQVLTLLAKQMPSFAAEIEKRIGSDDGVGKDAAEQVRVYAKNIIARFQTMCDQQAAYHRNQMLICEGRLQVAEQFVTMLEKDIVLERSIAARREELEKERLELEKQRQEIEAEKPKRSKRKQPPS